ncbi:hypothetical protein COCON_G00118730 [Conger conger]|uniref:Poly [ADP-ribose] polymerase n=1 Tax=Conger conger TaxID=82655 RepID=A0A9Q1DGG3_CONCO|nr:hypothetical protein COCON_G00118730 [Conger conger]
MGTFEEDQNMEIIEEDMRWFYEAEGGEWHMFGVNPTDQCPLTNWLIEVEYHINPNGCMDYRIADCIYRLDFSVMKQINLSTGMQRPITRRCSTIGHRSTDGKPIPTPSLWETDLPCQIISLDSGTQECQGVVKMFAKTNPDVPIRSIRRIQNIPLWESFCRKKAELTQIKKMPLEERRLFHGTPHKNIKAICTSNFDLKFVGSNGSVYGKGIYFARNASYALKFCVGQGKCNGITPSKTIILARVLVGEFTQGDKDLGEAPSKDRTNTSFYDSCVDRFSNPNIFVVFDRNQVYPEYLIDFD